MLSPFKSTLTEVWVHLKANLPEVTQLKGWRTLKSAFSPSGMLPLGVLVNLLKVLTVASHTCLTAFLLGHLEASYLLILSPAEVETVGLSIRTKSPFKYI